MAVPMLFQVVSQSSVVVEDGGTNISYAPGQVFSADPQNQSIVRLLAAHLIVPAVSSSPPAPGFIVVTGPPGPAGPTGPQGLPGVGAPTPLSVPNGGTGLATAPANGQVLIGNGTTYTLAGLTGTANQVVVTPAAGSITLSLPQSVNTAASPTFAGLTLSGLTANAFTYSGAGGLLSSTTAPTNGQLLIGSTGVAPVAAALTGTANEIVVTNGPGTITLSTPQGIGTTSTPQFAALGIGTPALASGLSLADANNLVLGTVTGTMFGTTASQKLSFFGAAPVVQIAGSTDVLGGLVTLGLRAASANPPLNLGTGTFTGGSATLANATSQLTLGTTNPLTVSTAAQTVGAATLTLPDFAGVSDTFAFVTFTQTLANKTLTAPTINGAALSGTLSGTPTFSGTVAFTATSPLSVSNGQILTVSTTAQTIGAATLTIPNFAGASDTFAFLTLAQTLANKTLTTPTINGAALSGTLSGTPTFSGTVAFTAASPLSVANGQVLTLATTAQTVGAATLTIPDFAGVADTFAFLTLAQTFQNKTIDGSTATNANIIKLNAAAYAPSTNPASTASTTQVMAGLAALTGGPASFTPRGTGRIRISIQAQAANGTATNGTLAQIRYGTGTAPLNGVAATGTTAGNSQTFTSATASASGSLTLLAEVSGLTVGTAYWVDLGQAAVTGGTASLSNINMAIEEL